MPRQQWTQIWSFETANLRIVAEVTDCEDDPAGHFDNPLDIEAVRSGHVAWFDARVRVLGPDHEELGADYLGCCAYDRPIDLFRDHSRGTRKLGQLRHEYAAVFAHTHRLGKTVKAWPGNRSAFLSRLAEIRQSIATLKRQLRQTAAVNPSVHIGWYGPDMVHEACREARATLAKLRTIRLRETA